MKLFMALLSLFTATVVNGMENKDQKGAEQSMVPAGQQVKKRIIRRATAVTTAKTNDANKTTIPVAENEEELQKKANDINIDDDIEKKIEKRAEIEGYGDHFYTLRKALNEVEGKGNSKPENAYGGDSLRLFNDDHKKINEKLDDAKRAAIENYEEDPFYIKTVESASKKRREELTQDEYDALEKQAYLNRKDTKMRSFDRTQLVPKGVVDGDVSILDFFSTAFSRLNSFKGKLMTSLEQKTVKQFTIDFLNGNKINNDGLSEKNLVNYIISLSNGIEEAMRNEKAPEEDIILAVREKISKIGIFEYMYFVLKNSFQKETEKASKKHAFGQKALMSFITMFEKILKGKKDAAELLSEDDADEKMEEMKNIKSTFLESYRFFQEGVVFFVHEIKKKKIINAKVHKIEEENEKNIAKLDAMKEKINILKTNKKKGNLKLNHLIGLFETLSSYLEQKKNSTSAALEMIQISSDDDRNVLMKAVEEKKKKSLELATQIETFLASMDKKDTENLVNEISDLKNRIDESFSVEKIQEEIDFKLKNMLTEEIKFNDIPNNSTIPGDFAQERFEGKPNNQRNIIRSEILKKEIDSISDENIEFNDVLSGKYDLGKNKHKIFIETITDIKKYFDNIQNEECTNIQSIDATLNKIGSGFSSVVENVRNFFEKVIFSIESRKATKQKMLATLRNRYELLSSEQSQKETFEQLNERLDTIQKQISFFKTLVPSKQEEVTTTVNKLKNDFAESLKLIRSNEELSKKEFSEELEKISSFREEFNENVLNFKKVLIEFGVEKKGDVQNYISNLKIFKTKVSDLILKIREYCQKKADSDKSPEK